MTKVNHKRMCLSEQRIQSIPVHDVGWSSKQHRSCLDGKLVAEISVGLAWGFGSFKGHMYPAPRDTRPPPLNTSPTVPRGRYQVFRHVSLWRLFSPQSPGCLSCFFTLVFEEGLTLNYELAFLLDRLGGPVFTH